MSTMKQLKKSDFLAAVTEEPMTKGDLIDALEEYEFIPSYIDYLMDHFEARNKIVKNEDGTFNLRAKKTGGSTSNEVFRVVHDDENGYSIETGIISEVDNEDGSWSKTQKAAIKKATSASFQFYKAETEAIRALLPEEETAEA